jgi:hypothetical protein
MHIFIDDREGVLRQGQKYEAKDNTSYTHLREECGAGQL